MRNKQRGQKGITLIALVVTIIILIILAGVSIAMLVGENGIIIQAQTAKEDTDEATLKEKLDMIALEREINGALSSTIEEDETDVFLEMMGDKEITQEDVDSFNETLQSYGKRLTTVSSITDMQKIGTDSNYPLDGLYVLLEDVSLQGHNWTPIGTEEEPFTGIFNGNNKTIDGFTLSNPEMNAGVFGVNSGSVKNVELTNVSIISTHTFVGGIAGQNNGLIDNCHVQSGSISGTGNDIYQDVNVSEARNSGSRVGGICGQNNDGGIIQNCTNEAEVTAGYRLVGGICGYSIGGDIINCENRGQIHGTYQIGGIVGDSEGLDINNISYINNCKNYGEIFQVQGTETNNIGSVGGIVGCNYKYSIIEKCSNEGIITAESAWQGGIVGTTNYIVQDCENKIELKSNNARIGGIAGYSLASIYRCKNTGDISGTLYVGGIVGSINKHTTGTVPELEELIVEECYNTGDVTGTIRVGGVIGELGAGFGTNSCYNTGNVSGAERIGGVIGDTITTSGEAKNLYNKGIVTATTNYVGGVVGILYSTLENAYNTGTVSMTSSSTTFGGITGYINTDYVTIDIIQNCYYLNTSSSKAVGNISTLDTTSSKTSDEIKNLADTLGNAFKNSTEGDGYPKLSWEE